MLVKERVWVRESVGVREGECGWERESVRVREREGECAGERERGRVCG